MYHQTVEIYDLPKLFNRLSKTSFWDYKEQQQKWLKLIWIAFNGKKPKSPLTKAKISMTRCSSKEPDVDGLMSGMKYPLDGLVKNDILIDDKPSIVSFQALWRKAPQKEGKLIIEIEEMAE